MRCTLSLLVLILVPASAAAQADERVVDLGVFEGPSIAPRSVWVYLPEAYAREPERRFPVLYVPDGEAIPLFFHIDRWIDRLSADGTIEPWIVVAIGSTVDRNRELSRDSDRYVDFVVDRVVPAVRARFRTRDGRSSAAMLGYSYGGLTALRASLRRSDVFGRAIAMSPSLWFAQRATLREVRTRPGLMPLRLWIDIGTREGRPGDAVPYMVADARALRDIAIARGMRFGSDFGYYEALGEEHGMEAGARRMAIALAFGLSDVDLSETAPDSVGVVRFDASRTTPYAVQATYGSRRLTWPASLAELRTAAGAPFGRATVGPGVQLRARVGGVSSE